MPTGLLKEDISRFLPSERDPCSCWPWQGEVNEDGYGVFNCVYPGGSERFSAQRSALMVFGNIPVYKHEDVIETCGNKLCCNPKHLKKVERAKCLI